MHQVEELCERIVLINRGRAVLYGALDGIRRRYAGHAVLVRLASGAADGGAALGQLPGVERVEAHNSALRLSLSSGAQPQEVLRALVDRDVLLEGFEIAEPTLDEIFIHVVQGDTDGPGSGEP
jgi:ABC-2 type transport system ATP-binding protein